MLRTTTAMMLVLGLVGALAACDRDTGRPESMEEPPGLPERTAEADPQGTRIGEPQGVQQGQGPQQPQGSQQPQPGAGDRAVVSDGDIEKFVSTQLEMAELQSKTQAEVREGKDPTAAQQQYQKEAGKVVEDSGLSVQRYQAIAHRVTEDPQLREKVQRQVTAALDKE